MTSSSYSFQPMSDCSTRTWSVSDASMPACFFVFLFFVVFFGLGALLCFF